MSQQAAYIPIDAGPSIEKTTETNDDQPAAESERHDLQRFTDSERRELVRCRACGRKTTVGGINPYEVCGARAGPEAGTRLASMAGVPGGNR